MRHSHTRTMPGRSLSSGNKYTKSDARSQDMWHEKTVIPWRGGVADRRDALFAIRSSGLFLSRSRQRVRDRIRIRYRISLRIRIRIRIYSVCFVLLRHVLRLLRFASRLLEFASRLLGFALHLLGFALHLLEFACDAVEWSMQTCRDATDRVPYIDSTADGIPPRDTGTPPRTSWHGTVRRTASDAITVTGERR